MRYPFGPMSVGDILSRGFGLLFSRFFVFYGIMLAVELPILFIQLLVPDLMISGAGPLVLMLPTMILQAIGTGALIRVVMQEYVDRPVRFGEAIRFALGRFGPLLGTSILSGLIVLLGTLACLIPGIYFGIVYALGSQVVVVEERSGMDALGRSKDLVDGYFWRVFGILLLVGLIAGALGGVVTGVAEVALPYTSVDRFGAHLASYPNYAIVTLLNALIQVVVQAFTGICTTLLYFDLRNRKEAFDLELEADKISAWTERFHPHSPPASTDIQAPDAAVQPPGPPDAPGETDIRPAP